MTNSTAGERVDYLQKVWDKVNALGAPDTAWVCAEDQVYSQAIDDALAAIDKVRATAVTPEFLERSSKAAIRALRGLEQTAIMLEKWAPECFPENERGQVHFARALMESAAEEIRKAWADAIAEIAPAAPLTSDAGSTLADETK